jgi:transposase
MNPARRSAHVRLRDERRELMLVFSLEGAGMKVIWKDPEDPSRLRDLIDNQKDAAQRDRYRVVFIAGEGLGAKELERDQIAQVVGRSRQFVDEWVRRYRRRGLEALVPKRQPGMRPRLSFDQQQQLVAMLEAGPDPSEGIAAYNGPILREKIQQRFGVLYSLSAVYALLHRLGYNDLMPRPLHPGTDPAALEAFKKKNSRKSSRRSAARTQASRSWSTTRTRPALASMEPSPASGRR